MGFVLTFLNDLTSRDRDTIVMSRLPYFTTIGGALGVVMFIGWIVMMVKASRGQYYKLPIFGNFADWLIDQINV